MSRARFVDRVTGEDVFLYDAFDKYYHCVFCRKHGKRSMLYGISEMIDHKFNVHCKMIRNERGSIDYETLDGHDVFSSELPSRIVLI